MSPEPYVYGYILEKYRKEHIDVQRDDAHVCFLSGFVTFNLGFFLRKKAITKSMCEIEGTSPSVKPDSHAEASVGSRTVNTRVHFLREHHIGQKNDYYTPQ